VRVPTFEMGRLAAELLLRHVEGGGEVATQKIYLDAELVVRKSTPRRGAAAGEGAVDEGAVDEGAASERGAGAGGAGGDRA
jgi:hypothetical protein